MNHSPHDLLSHAASEIDVPAPDAAAVIARGAAQTRSQRTGRALRWGVPIAIGTAASVAAAALLFPLPDRNPQIDFAQVAAPAFDANATAQNAQALDKSGAFSIGTTLYLGSADPTPIELDVPAIRGLYPTSAGVLVRHGKNTAMDVASRYTLVAPDGSITAITLEPGDVRVGTDPAQPYFAYAVGARGTWTILVIDLRTGDHAGSFEVEGDFSWGGWDAPPVSLSGETVWVGLDNATHGFDWRTGAERPSALPGSVAPEVRGGRQAIEHRNEDHLAEAFTVIDAADGTEIHSVDVSSADETDGPTLGILSPDGATLMVGPYMRVGEDGVVRDTADTKIIDLATGNELALPTSEVGGFGWTPTGQVFSVNGEQTTLCDAAAQQCITHDLDLDLTPAEIDGIELAGLVTDS